MPRISTSTLAEHREATTTRLLDAFNDLLAEHGYEQVSLRDVAERAGVVRTAVYNYYRDKLSLLVAWSQRRVERFMELLRHELAASEDPTEQLRILVVTVLSEFAIQPVSGTSSLAAALPPEQREAFMHHVDPIREVLSDILAAGMRTGDFREQEPGTSADMILACLDTQRLSLARDGELSDSVHRVLPFITLGITGQQQWR